MFHIMAGDAAGLLVVEKHSQTGSYEKVILNLILTDARSFI